MSKRGTGGESHGHAQRHFIKCNDKILIILEGRDASSKDGTITRIVQHLSPRERVMGFCIEAKHEEF